MNAAAVPHTRTDKVRDLFDSKPPVLVEVRFPGMATSPDWYFFREEEEFETLLSRLGAGVEIRLSSVWDLTDPTQGVMIGK